ncbi:MAG: hypothetical protein QOF53_2420 [Nocardioidaceae bacterium]|nr:hypothetical protein [Nocardioidaceae bacterium]
MLRAFGVHPPARRLAGGQGRSWLAGDVVLKPGGGPVQGWLARTLADVRPDGFRIAAALPTRDGRWLCEGWSATRWVEGREPDRADQTTWVEIVEAGRAFHRAVAEVARPECLDARTDAWAAADRVAWGERPLALRPELADLARRLQAALEPPSRSQLVHGDLTGNVLFAPGVDPAVIDISPYWRPPEYAEGVVLADALTWHGASANLLELAGVPLAAVARALLFRIATTNERSTSAGVDLHDEAGRFVTALAAIGL